jgi:hypothetical protein
LLGPRSVNCSRTFRDSKSSGEQVSEVELHLEDCQYLLEKLNQVNRMAAKVEEIIFYRRSLHPDDPAPHLAHKRFCWSHIPIFQGILPFRRSPKIIASASGEHRP